MFPSTEVRVPQLAERSQKLTNFLWSRKRAVEDLMLRQKAVSMEKDLWEKSVQNIGRGEGLKAVRDNNPCSSLNFRCL